MTLNKGHISRVKDSPLGQNSFLGHNSFLRLELGKYFTHCGQRLTMCLEIEPMAYIKGQGHSARLKSRKKIASALIYIFMKLPMYCISLNMWTFKLNK